MLLQLPYLLEKVRHAVDSIPLDTVPCMRQRLVAAAGHVRSISCARYMLLPEISVVDPDPVETVIFRSGQYI